MGLQCLGPGVGWTDFGANEHLLSRDPLQRHAEGSFTGAIVIGLGGVEIVTPALHRETNDVIHVLLTLRSPILAPAIGPTAHSQDRQLQAVISACATLNLWFSDGFGSSLI